MTWNAVCRTAPPSAVTTFLFAANTSPLPNQLAAEHSNSASGIDCVTGLLDAVGEEGDSTGGG